MLFYLTRKKQIFARKIFTKFKQLVGVFFVKIRGCFSSKAQILKRRNLKKK